MTLCVCACLNVSVRAACAASHSAPGPTLSDKEQRDAFFREELFSCPSSGVKLEVSQSALRTQRLAGSWLIHACLACGQSTHAERQDDLTSDILINKATLTTPDAVETLKSSPNFSPVFKLLVPEVALDNDSKENVDVNTMPGASHTVGILGKQLSRTLQTELEAIEESVRLFRDKKYAEFEEYRERAHKDHKVLASIVSRARVTADDPPLSQLLPPLQRRRLSSFKDAKKLKHNVVKNTRNTGSDDSLDAEDIFDLEGDMFAASGNGNNSDADDYGSDNSGSNEEGEGARVSGRVRHAPGVSIARSMPMNVPKFSQHMNSRPHAHDDEEDTQDIAASIKALARSVHGDVFGDLPRPRFSTQI